MCVFLCLFSFLDVSTYAVVLLFCVSFQIQAAVKALRNTRGLPWPKGNKKKEDEDVLDWLQAMFGFQVG